MSDMRYTKDHEFIRVEGESAVIGITPYAQEQLGDVVFVELPETGTSFSSGDEAAVVESVKAASEVYAPISGEVMEVNADLEGEPEPATSTPRPAASAPRSAGNEIREPWPRPPYAASVASEGLGGSLVSWKPT